MRGCIQQATKDKWGLPKGHHTYNVILAIGRGANGKHKQRWVRFHGTRKGAEERLTELLGEKDRGELVDPSKRTVGAWLDDWLETAIRPRRALHTYIGYSSVIKKHLKPGLGHVVLQKLTPMDIERYYAGLKLAPRTMAIHHAILTSALAKAVKNRILRRHGNVAQDVTNKPRGAGTSEDVLHNVWTVDEARRFLTHVKSEKNAQYGALFAIALDSGVRVSELLGLYWRDLDGTSLKVERQLLGRKEDEDGSLHLVTSLPKRGRARSLTISDTTVILLREHKRQQAELKLKNRLYYADFGLMFAQGWEHKNGKHSPLGGPLNREAVSAQLDRLCRGAGVKRITPHGLRHTCATLLLSAGVPANVVQRRLGHSRVEMTLNVYSHILPSMQDDAASRLETKLHG